MAKITGYSKKAVKEVICYQCSAKIEYLMKEVKSFKSYDYTGDFDIENYIECPGCGNQVHVKGY